MTKVVAKIEDIGTEGRIRPVLELLSVSKAFGSFKALDAVNLEVMAGEIHCLAGENGAGKSTLIKILTGAVRRDEGEYRLSSESVGDVSPAEAHSKGVGVVYQELSLMPDLSVEDNLLMGRIPARAGLVRTDAQRNAAQVMLSRVGLEQLDPATLVADLPTTTRQMVEIAKFGSEAKLMIFDEPTTSLSGEEAERLLRLVQQLKEEGVAVLYITHRLEEMLEIGDRITVLRDGKIVTTAPANEFDHDSLIATMVGRQIENLYPDRKKGGEGSVLLSVRNLRLEGSDREVSFEVRSGEIVGLGGLVGAGRSEILRAIFGADPVESGRVDVDGEKLQPGSPRRAVQAGLGFLTEDRKEMGLLSELSVRENVTLADVSAFSRVGMVSRSEEDSLVGGILPRLNLGYRSSEQLVTDLSGGNQQKVLLARWLATNAKVMMFDEPTKGVDVGAKTDIYGLIEDLAKHGLGILVVSSYMPELLGICDRILVVSDGAITGELDAEQASEEKVLRLASRPLVTTSSPTAGAKDNTEDEGEDGVHP